MTPSWRAVCTHLISEELPYEEIAKWLGNGPEVFFRMYRKRLVHFHAGQPLESLTLFQLLEHLEMVEWGLAQGEWGFPSRELGTALGAAPPPDTTKEPA